MVKVTILGAGAWGIGLGLTAYRAGHEVTLWSPFDLEVECLREKRHHPQIMRNILLPEAIGITTQLELALQAEIVLCVIPAQTLRSVMQQSKAYAQAQTIFISCAKGIEVTSGQFLSDVIMEVLDSHAVGVLAGPNFAHEVALNLPAQAVLAFKDFSQAQRLANILSHPNFNFIPISDVRGVDLASAVKNILAIGCGIITGANLGENARATYLTIGLQDLNQLGEILGCEAKTFSTVAGIGDIMLTCLSPTSRNMNFGMEIGSGQSFPDLKNAKKPLTEGIYTVKAIKHIMDHHHLKLSSIQFVDEILYHQHSVLSAFSQLRL